MHLLRALKRFLQFVTDPDTYCLLWLAIRHHFKGSAGGTTTPRKKSAKAVNAG